MNTYESKIAARQERYQELAVKAQTESGNTAEKAVRMLDCLWGGQPVLVGHHSEKKHRALLGRSDDAMRKASKLTEKAAYYEEKAASVGTGGISSDDPDAIAKLQADLTKREEKQVFMKKANTLIKKNDRAGLVALGLTQEQADKMFIPDFCNRIGFASCELTNNNANIKRLKGRIEELEKLAARENKEEICKGFTYREDREENRIMFVFEGKPAENIRVILKRAAFKWSPTRGVWVRQITPNALYSAKIAKKELNELS